MSADIEKMNDIEFLKEFEKRRTIGVQTSRRRDNYSGEMITGISLVARSNGEEYKVELAEV